MLALHQRQADPTVKEMLELLDGRLELYKDALVTAQGEERSFLQGAAQELRGFTEAVRQGPPEQEANIEGLDSSYTMDGP